MRRILLATTAILALSAASPAFAFNIALVGQIGSNHTTTYQIENNNSGQNTAGTTGNLLLGAQVGVDNKINNGVCWPQNKCSFINDPGQVSDKGDTNLAGVGQFGAFNYARNRQDAEGNNKGSTNGALILQGGLANSASNDQTADSGNTNISVQAQLGAFNRSSVTQDTGSGKSSGDNVAGTLQVGFGNKSSVTQTGGDNWSAVGQFGAGNTFTSTQVSN